MCIITVGGVCHHGAAGKKDVILSSYRNGFLILDLNTVNRRQQHRNAPDDAGKPQGEFNAHKIVQYLAEGCAADGGLHPKRQLPCQN